MGYNNNRNNRGKNQQQQKRYRGKNVHPLSGSVQMGQYAVRLIENLAFGNFNMDTDSVYFQNQDFLMAAIHEVENKIKEENIYNTALSYTYGTSTDITVLKLMNNHKRALDAWNLIYSTFVGILHTQDLSLLVGLMSRLPDYRYVM